MQLKELHRLYDLKIVAIIKKKKNTLQEIYNVMESRKLMEGNWNQHKLQSTRH
jgi:hypothetical protein